ncbi:hypothetical protein [Nocardioides sp. YIM 152588]|uniref:hypothetical protein n=1 Tax=Nocardioides sp. YIM 152588 TaxID=3158259 RepID=UPI0032E4F763
MTTAARDLAALHPDARLASSRRKIRAPFVLDDSMRFYSPQANVDALTHPRVAPWLDYVRDEWTPAPVDGADSRIALLVPCTKYKPYCTSREHRAINAALLAAGWRPSAPYDGPPELLDALDPGESGDLLATAPLVRDGVALDRIVMSEPLGLVPYEHTMLAPAALGGGQSPATSYDDPGLFEARGTSVSPERDDCTAVRRADGSWAWGANERAALARMVREMSGTVAATLDRLDGTWTAVLGWVSPGLTHKMFLEAIPGRTEPLPTRAWTEEARADLAARLAAEGRSAGPRAVAAVYARGDGHDTPLGLPELTSRLVARIDELTR